MSADKCEVDTTCASCGIAENDDIKLKKCTACYLVRYCSIKCQKEHRPKHKRACKKRVAELHDELLFKQPESSHNGDCPICMIPLPLEPKKSLMTGCCTKLICVGCTYAQMEQGVLPKCPFCRHPMPTSQMEFETMRRKRAEENYPGALSDVAAQRLEDGDYKGAFEYWTKAVELGDVQAHFQLSVMYYNGNGLPGKDEKKRVYHLEQAAIAGHPDARINLGIGELENGQHGRAIKHFIIAANLGSDAALETLKDAYRQGMISREVFAVTLRAHQAAVDATKSPHREAAEAAL